MTETTCCSTHRSCWVDKVPNFVIKHWVRVRHTMRNTLVYDVQSAEKFISYFKLSQKKLVTARHNSAQIPSWDVTEPKLNKEQLAQGSKGGNI